MMGLCGTGVAAVTLRKMGFRSAGAAAVALRRMGFHSASAAAVARLCRRMAAFPSIVLLFSAVSLAAQFQASSLQADPQGTCLCTAAAGHALQPQP
eukprot:366563-Chlamydomonas_euryale.AAC.13